jgi:hypothetical protein
VAQTYRVQYSRKPGQSEWVRPETLTMDLTVDLEMILEHLPPESYVMSIEDLTAGKTIHWSRWPKAYRPGFGG